MATDKNAKVVILGLSDDIERYSYLAYKRLLNNGYTDLVGVTPRKIELPDIVVVNSLSGVERPVHTLTVYLSAEKLNLLIDQIIDLQPERIILNPGTENLTLKIKAQANNIDVVEGCTLVLLGTNQF